MEADHAGRGWRRVVRSVRFRITALATLVVVVVLVGTGIALVLLQQRALTSAIDDSLRQRAGDLAAVYAAGDVPTQLGVGADETFVVILGPDGAVIAGSENAGGLDTAALPRVAGVATVRVPEVDDDPFRLLTEEIDGPAGGGLLHVAGSLDDVRDGSEALGSSLFVAIPFVAALLAAVVWWLVGRALQPVEAIRTEVAEISGSELHRRVPLPQTGDEIERLAETMNAMLDRVEGASRRQQQFAADASHELRSPLTRMRSELEVDLAYPSTSDLAATHRSVLEEIDGLEALMDDLLYLARTDAARDMLDTVVVDASQIVGREVERLRDATDHTIELDAANPAWIDAEARSFGRAIGNVLANAVNHAEHRVAASIRSGQGAVEIAIADDGPGIPAASHDRVFERFARLDEARTAATGGTGLGLAIARDIVERHGGSITIDGSYGDGARFVIVVPAAT